MTWFQPIGSTLGLGRSADRAEGRLHVQRNGRQTCREVAVRGRGYARREAIWLHGAWFKTDVQRFGCTGRGFCQTRRGLAARDRVIGACN